MSIPRYNPSENIGGQGQTMPPKNDLGKNNYSQNEEPEIDLSNLGNFTDQNFLDTNETEEDSILSNYNVEDYIDNSTVVDDLIIDNTEEDELDNLLGLDELSSDNDEELVQTDERNHDTGNFDFGDEVEVNSISFDFGDDDIFDPFSSDTNELGNQAPVVEDIFDFGDVDSQESAIDSEFFKGFEEESTDENTNEIFDFNDNTEFDFNTALDEEQENTLEKEEDFYFDFDQAEEETEYDQEEFTLDQDREIIEDQGSEDFESFINDLFEGEEEYEEYEEDEDSGDFGFDDSYEDTEDEDESDDAFSPMEYENIEENDNDVENNNNFFDTVFDENNENSYFDDEIEDEYIEPEEDIPDDVKPEELQETTKSPVGIFGKIKEKFNNIKNEVAAEMKGEEYDPTQELSVDEKNRKQQLRAEREAEEEEIDQEQDDRSSNSKKKPSKKGKTNPFSAITSLYKGIAGFFFKILNFILGILASLPLIGILIKPILAMTKLLEKIALFMPVLFIAGIFIVSNIIVVPLSSSSELPDQGYAKISDFAYDKNTGNVSALAENKGDIIAEIAVEFKIYKLNPSINPKTWIIPEEVSSCSSDSLSIDIDNSTGVSAQCEIVKGFTTRVTGNIIS